MTVLRIFVSYEATDAAFATQLINDLRHAGAEVITDKAEASFTSTEQSQYFIVVQTPASLQSPRIQVMVDTVLNQVQAGQMEEVLRVIAPTLNAVEAQQVPIAWATTPVFDASQDYLRALARLCLHLGIDIDDLHNAPPPAPSILPLSLSEPQGTENKSPLPDSFSAQRSATLDRPQHPYRYPREPSRSQFIFLLLAMALVLVIAGVTIFIGPSLTHGQPTPSTATSIVAIHTPTPTPTPILTPTPRPTPTPTPTPGPTLIPTPTPAPLVLPRTQTYVLCSPSSLASDSANLASFGGDVSDNCGGQFFYNTLPSSMQEHYILQLNLPAVEAVDSCNIYGFIPSIHASAQNMHTDLFVNGVWLGWKGQNINQNSPKGWQDMGLTYSIHATGNVTIDVKMSDGTDKSGELAWTTLKFVCRMVSTH